MKKILPLFLSLIILVGCQAEQAMEDDGHHHDHSTAIHLGPDGAPEVALNVFEDPKSGWNIQVQTENFRFAPENASTEHVKGEGHAHFYVDGEKIGRLYGEWYHFDEELSSGDHEFKVNLNANDHSPFMVNGEEIMATQIITVP